MPPKSTVCKAHIHVSDMSRHYYGSHNLTVALHPSETDQRMMIRVLAFALHAEDELTFGNGITDNDAADLWVRDATGAVTLWIEVGLPDPRLLRKAAGRARQVVLYAYCRAVDRWWTEHCAELDRFQNLSVIKIAEEAASALAGLADKTMTLQFTIQDGTVLVSADEATVHLDLTALKVAATAADKPSPRR